MSYTSMQMSNALTALFEIAPDCERRFKFRMTQYKREFGVPGSPGKGHFAEYQFADILHAAIWLKLSSLGITTEVFRELSAKRDLSKNCDLVVVHRKNPFEEWQITIPNFDVAFDFRRTDCLVIDFSRLKRKLATLLGEPSELSATLVAA